MRASFIKIGLLLGTLAGASQANAQGSLEIPQAGSVQSGISVVSGWHCSANRIEVSFDGGPRIAAASGTTRADTQGVCGDQNNGFSLLWAYGLLGSGTHNAVAYADGVEFGRATFEVTDIANKDFLRGVSAARRVYGFPDLNHDVVLGWQEANQNFVITDMYESMNSYDVAGMWEIFAGSSVDAETMWALQPSLEDPSVGEVVVFTINNEWYGYVWAGAMRGNFAILETNPDLGSDVSARIEVTFMSKRSAIIKLVSCSPTYQCPSPVGSTQSMEKFFPEQEHDAVAITAIGSRQVAAVSQPKDQTAGDSEYDARCEVIRSLSDEIKQRDLDSSAD